MIPQISNFILASFYFKTMLGTDEGEEKEHSNEDEEDEKQEEDDTPPAEEEATSSNSEEEKQDSPKSDTPETQVKGKWY